METLGMVVVDGLAGMTTGGVVVVDVVVTVALVTVLVVVATNTHVIISQMLACASSRILASEIHTAG